MLNNYRERNIDFNSSLVQALKKMDNLGKKLLIVTSKEEFIGLLSIGDIQRAIIANIDLNSPVSLIIRTDFKFGTLFMSSEEKKQMMILERMEMLPVLDEKRKLCDIVFWEDIFGGEQKINYLTFNCPVVIMAGGQGTRLKPLTNVLPKPLIPYGDQSIIEDIIDKFKQHGCISFYISVNYKKEIIKYYIDSLNLSLNYTFIEEDMPLGTAGSLHLLKDIINETFFITNCDIIIEEDYYEIYKYHKNQNNELTIVAALKNLSFPYGVIETEEQGILKSIIEKPDFHFKINSGMYILEPELLNEIPENQFFHITDLIIMIKERGGKVGVFPVSENSWQDIGTWPDYLKLISQ